MRGVFLTILVFCLSPLCSGGEEATGSEPLSPMKAMELRLRDAVAEADNGLADRARVSVNLLVYSGQTSFGSVLGYRDETVGRDNYAADSKLVREEMLKLVEDDGNTVVTCLAWHYRKGVLLFYGGSTYAPEGGRGMIDASKSVVSVPEEAR